MNYSLVIFDLDGTLVDSLQDLTDGVNAAIVPRGAKACGTETIRKAIGNGAYNLIQKSLPEASEAEVRQCLGEFLDYYQVHCTKNTVLYPGTREFLDSLKGGPTLCLLTNKPERSTHKILADLNLDSYFKAVIGGDTFTTRKPDPEGLLHLIHQFGAQPAKTLLFGDGETDLEAAHNAGIHVAAVSWGLRKADDLLPLNPTYWIHQWIQIHTFARFAHISEVQI
jgi:phosphoglycolate phosphatase